MNKPQRDAKYLDFRNVNWEELKPYRYDIYPHKLVILTTAPPEKVREAADKMCDLGMNIECILQAWGYPALTGEGDIVDVDAKPAKTGPPSDAEMLAKIRMKPELLSRVLSSVNAEELSENVSSHQDWYERLMEGYEHPGFQNMPIDKLLECWDTLMDDDKIKAIKDYLTPEEIEERLK